MTWQQKVRNVEPYTAGEQPKISNLIKLNTNENPYSPSPKIQEILATLDTDLLRYYPNSDGQDLQQSIANNFGLTSDQVFLGNGSDEVLALAFLTFFNGSKPVLFPSITYSFYVVYCNLYNIPHKLVEVKEDFTFDINEFKQPNDGIIFPNPNAPTGLLVDLNYIEEVLIENPDNIVIIDEAYIDFGGTSAVPLLKKYDNLLIIQTYSKSRALAGCRLGYALGNTEVIKHLHDVKNSFNSYPIDTITQLVGKASMEDKEYFETQIARVIHTRETFKKELKELGFLVPESYANFVFVKHPDYDGEELFTYLRSKSIVVRHFKAPAINQYLRISIGTDDQMEQVIIALQEYLKK